MKPTTGSLSGGGREWVVEAYGCDPVRLGDITVLQILFNAAVTDLSLHPVAHPQWHQFPTPGGITGMLMLAESHLTVHTFPEHASLCMNLFCCTPRPAWNWQAQLAQLVGASDVRVRTFERHYAMPTPMHNHHNHSLMAVANAVDTGGDSVRTGAAVTTVSESTQ